MYNGYKACMVIAMVWYGIFVHVVRIPAFLSLCVVVIANVKHVLPGRVRLTITFAPALVSAGIERSARLGRSST